MDVRGAPHSIINSRTAVLIHNAGDPTGVEARPGRRSTLEPSLIPSAAYIPAQRLLCPSEMTVFLI